MTDQELLPLFAKMLPNVTVSGETITESTPLGVRNIEWYGLLYLCHRIEEGMTSNEYDAFRRDIYKDAHSYKEVVSAPWQVRVQTATKVKGLL